jgi:hypothetical protein
MGRDHLARDCSYGSVGCCVHRRGIPLFASFNQFKLMNNAELSLDQLQIVEGGGVENKLAKILKPKPKVKEIKIPKSFVYDLDSAVKWGASSGPFLPKPNYASQNMYPGF